VVSLPVLDALVLRDGRFERRPSFDVVSAFDGVPIEREHFAASGERVLWGSEGQLARSRSGRPDSFVRCRRPLSDDTRRTEGLT
jgi:hypothetical protein